MSEGNLHTAESSTTSIGNLGQNFHFGKSSSIASQIQSERLFEIKNQTLSNLIPEFNAKA